MAGILEEIIGMDQRRSHGEYALSGGAAPDTVDELEAAMAEAERADMLLVEDAPEAAELTETIRIGKAEKKVIDAFTDKKSGSSNYLKTDGKVLDGLWMGGQGIAKWVGGKIKLPDLGSKSAEIVQKAIKRKTPKNLLSGGLRLGLPEEVEPVPMATGYILVDQLTEAYMGTVYKDGKDIYVDTAFVNSVSSGAPGFHVDHMGFGEFTIVGPGGVHIEVDRMRGKEFPGQSGRSHKLYPRETADKKIVSKLVAQMIKKGKAKVVKKFKVPSPKTVAKRTGMRLSGKATGKAQQAVLRGYEIVFDETKGKDPWAPLAQTPGLHGIKPDKRAKAADILVKKGLLDKRGGGISGDVYRLAENTATENEDVAALTEALNADAVAEGWADASKSAGRVPVGSYTVKIVGSKPNDVKMMMASAKQAGLKIKSVQGFDMVVEGAPPKISRLVSGLKSTEGLPGSLRGGPFKIFFKEEMEKGIEATDASILKALADADNFTLSAPGIAEATGIEKPVVRDTLETMGRSNLVARTHPASDNWRLTHFGEAALTERSTPKEIPYDKYRERHRKADADQGFSDAEERRLKMMGVKDLINMERRLLKAYNKDRSKGNKLRLISVQNRLARMNTRGQGRSGGGSKGHYDIFDHAERDGDAEGILEMKKDLGKAEVIHGMKFGGTRYKFRQGIFIDEVDKTGEFRVSQAGRPSKLLGVAKSLKKAKEIALKKAEFVDYGSFPESVERGQTFGEAEEKGSYNFVESFQKDVEEKAGWVQRQVIMKKGYTPKEIHGAYGGEAAYIAQVRKWMTTGGKRNAMMIDSVVKAILAKEREERLALKARNARRRKMGESAEFYEAEEKGSYKAKGPLEKMIGEMVRGQSGKWLSEKQMKAMVAVLNKKGITKPSKDSYDDIARIVGKSLKAMMKNEESTRPFEEAGRRRSKKSQRAAWMRAFADEMKKVLTGKVPLGHDGVPIGFDWNDPIYLFGQGHDPKKAAQKVAKRYPKGEGVERSFDLELSEAKAKLAKEGKWVKIGGGDIQFKWNGMVYGEIHDRRHDGSRSKDRYSVEDLDEVFEKLLDAKKAVLARVAAPKIKRDWPGGYQG